MTKHRYDLGVIGNCSFMAYIDKDANVSWMCWPRFDSSFIFGKLLDEDKGGYFYIKPAEKDYSSRQYYLENTNVLCTEFTTSEGRFRVVDFAPRFSQYERYFKPLMLFRKVEPLEGHPKVVVGIKPVGEYGRVETESYIGSNHIRFLGLDKPLRLTTNFPQSFIFSEKGIVLDSDYYCCLSYGIPLEAPLRSTSEDFLSQTIKYWRTWVHNSTIPSIYQKEVIRSSLVLKLHQFEDTGAIIAAGTTSLPEYPGEGRNWDYRFCWMRDSFYTLRAINNLGHFEELLKYSGYIQNVAGFKDSRFQPVYSITGNHTDMIEKILPLEGYLGNQPVRIGNQASEHIQNDVYGQVLVSLLPLYTDERFVDKDNVLALRKTWALLDKIAETIDEPDAGLWEFRNTQQKHCYTFLFHWAGSHAAAKIGTYLKDEKLVRKARKLITLSAKNIEACYNYEKKVYQQAIGSENLDASLFQMITMNYLKPGSKKAINHLKGLEKELIANKNLFYRYKHYDDFGTPKSTFLVCAFWYVEALAATGEVKKAREVFENLFSYSNHLGLFSEDVDASTGAQWGNFPQTYSHVGLMNAAFMISRKLNIPEFLNW